MLSCPEGSYILTGMRIPKRGWTILSAVESVQVLHKLRGQIMTTCFITIPFVLIVTLFSLHFLRSFMQSIRLLTTHMNYLANGDFSNELKLVSNDELGRLTDCFEWMRKRIATLSHNIEIEQQNRREQEILCLEARYHALQLQHNPHFLFNMLDSISSIALLRNQPEISRIIILLAKLLRYNLDNDSPLTSLHDELHSCRRYTQLYETLYQNQLAFSYDVDAELFDCEVPSFSIHPLLENAVRHGLEKQTTHGHVLIHAYQEDEKLFISVNDNGVGFDREVDTTLSPEATGDSLHLRIGLRNLMERIHLLYGTQYGLHIRSVPGRGTQVTIELPLRRFTPEK